MQKKKNRILALVVTLTMVLSLCEPWTFALEEDGSSSVTPEVSVVETDGTSDEEGTDDGDADAEDTDTEYSDAEGTDAEDTDTEDIDAESTDDGDADAEDTDAEDTDAEGTDAEDTDTEDSDVADTDTEDSDAEDTDTENPDAGDTDAEDTDTVDTDAEGTDDGDTDAADTDTEDTDAEDTDAEGTDDGDTDAADTDTEDTGAEDANAEGTDDGDTDAVDTDNGDTDAEDANGGDTDDEDTDTSSVAALSWLVVMQPSLSSPDTQTIVVGFDDSSRAPEYAEITIYEEDTGAYQTCEASVLTEGAAEFDIEYASGASGCYYVETLRYTYDGVETELELSEIGIEAYYGVDTEVETVPDEVLVSDDECNVELEVSSMTEDGTLEHMDSLEDALFESESVEDWDEEALISAMSLDDELSVASDTGSSTSDSGSDASDGNIVIVLDPGHDASHAGAQCGSYQEATLTLKIAQYCKEALEQYRGITVYMTRTTSACAFPNAKDPEKGTTGTSRACLFARVEYAASVGADYFISFHLNSGGGKGAEIYYPNANYATSKSNSAVPSGTNLNKEGKDLSQSILDQLMALGLTAHSVGVQSTNSEYGWTYSDGSEADDYLVIRESKKEGFCGIIIEHCFLDSSDASNYLSSEAKLKAIGVADATGIAEYLELDVAAISLTRTLSYGMSGSDVTEVQERLKELGYYKGSLNGSFDPKTEAAVIMFQAANGMDVNSAAFGTVDSWTVNALNSSSAVAFSSLKSGSTGNAVYLLQQALIDLGYLDISAPDSIYGRMSTAAIEDFQRENGLTVTGVANQATLALIYNRNTETFFSNVLSYGDTGSEVKELQTQLKKLGYYKGDVSENFDEKTEAAVIMFQAANGKNAYSSTFGSVGVWTQDQLKSSSVVKCSTIQSGAKGNAVYRIQKYLISLGYLTISYPDSIYGKLTTAALKDFQSSNSLKETGIADQATLAVLYNRSTSTNPSVVTAANGSLAYGDSGDEVMRLQDRLRRLGYLKSQSSGTFDAETEAAVIMFQIASGVSLDEAKYGTVEEKTLTALNYTAATTFSSYKSGDRGAAVYWIQKYLISLYYLNISVPDYSYGKLTTAALKEFQEDNGLKATGIANQATLILLFNRNAAAHVTTVSTKTVSYGSNGSDVTLLQRRLRELGYLTVLPDGIFGAKTEAALIMFQAANGMGVSSTSFGKETSWTITKLNSSSAVKFSSLKSGSTGKAVYRLQKYLIKLGYLSLSEPNSSYDDMTKAAVEDFQLQNSLTKTGVANQATLALLYNRNTKTLASEVLNYGDKGSAVTTLQKRLKALGYLAVSADGIFGAKTEAAIIMFQAASGMNVNSSTFGIDTTWTNTKLNSSSAAKFASLKSGSTGTAVACLQKYLIKLGYLNLSAPNSSYDDMTEAAVEDFQSDNGLTANGVANQATLALLYNRNTKTLSAKALNYGDKGSDVTTLQKRLKELGYFTDEANGSYGATTEAAVIMFQAASGMNVYSSTLGSVGTWTNTKLNSSSAVKFSSFKSGSTGTAVACLQKYLIKLGYLDSDNLTSKFDERTTVALKTFQADNGLSATGVADQATLAVLYNRKTAKRAELNTELSYGDTGDQVKLLQTRLIGLGYLTASASGTYGAETQAAVVAFQGANGISYSNARIELYGSVDKTTLTALNKSSAVAFSTLSTSTAAKNSAVKVMQIFLRDMGYLTSTPNGTFDETTKNALILYQKTNGLKQSGTGNLTTLQALYNPDKYNTLYLREKTANAENAQAVWDALIEAGLSETGAAALMGNLYAESGMEPTNLQNTYNKSLGMTDSEYTAAVSDGTYTNFVNDRAGYGLAQWTYYSLKQDLYDYYLTWKETDETATIGDLDLQLSFLIEELQTDFPSLWAKLETADDILTASNAVLTGFERPADQGYYVQTTRAGYGMYYLNQFGS